MSSEPLLSKHAFKLGRPFQVGHTDREIVIQEIGQHVLKVRFLFQVSNKVSFSNIPIEEPWCSTGNRCVFLYYGSFFILEDLSYKRVTDPVVLK